MARLNIEDCWWTDPRRSLLAKSVGSDELADAIIIRAWRLAQQFWRNERGLIPMDLFEAVPHFQAIIDAKLADVRESFGERSVYVRGSSAYLDWVREKREQAREAGKKSAEVRKKKSGSAQPRGGKGDKSADKVSKQPNENRTKSNGTEPSVSGSFSVSGSSSDSSSGSVGQKIIAAYCDAWMIRYGANPTIVGRDAKQLRVFAEEVGFLKAKAMLEAFLRMNDSWFLTKRHDVQTFLNNLGAVTQYFETGETLTRSDIRNADTSATNAATLRALREGGL